MGKDISDFPPTLISRKFIYIAFCATVALVCVVSFGLLSPSAFAQIATTSDETLEKEVTALVKDANNAIERQDWTAASVLAKRGLAALGNRYNTPDIIDDTDMHLIAADIEEKEGHLQNAATNRCRFLASRLELFRRKIGLMTSLWQMIEQITQQIPFSQVKIETALKTRLHEDQRNEATAFLKGQNVDLAYGMRVSAVELRIPLKNTFKALIVLDIDGACITTDQLRERYGELIITESPHHGYPDEATAHTSHQRWGDLSFGFKERNRECLAYIVLAPK
jgi:hypothetical protein